VHDSYNWHRSIENYSTCCAINEDNVILISTECTKAMWTTTFSNSPSSAKFSFLLLCHLCRQYQFNNTYTDLVAVQCNMHLGTHVSVNCRKDDTRVIIQCVILRRNVIRVTPRSKYEGKEDNHCHVGLPPYKHPRVPKQMVFKVKG
jgi:ribosomal protein L33